MKLINLHEGLWAHDLKNIRHGEMVIINRCRYSELVGKTAKVLELRDVESPNGLVRELLIKIRGHRSPIAVKEANVSRT